MNAINCRNSLWSVVMLIFCLSSLFAEENNLYAPVEIEYEEVAGVIFDKLFNNDISVIPDIDWQKIIVDSVLVGDIYNDFVSGHDKSNLQIKTIREISNLMHEDNSSEEYNRREFCADSDGEYYLFSASWSREIYFAFHLVDSKFLLYKVTIDVIKNAPKGEL